MAYNEVTGCTVEFPSDLEIVITREYAAPRELVFDVFTKPEHIRHHVASFGEHVLKVEADLHVGGSYHFVIVPDGGPECSFVGTYLDIDPPFRSQQTWGFEGWPDVHAVETLTLTEDEGVTTLHSSLVFDDEAGRARMRTTEGAETSYALAGRYIEELLGRSS